MAFDLFRLDRRLSLLDRKSEPEQGAATGAFFNPDAPDSGLGTIALTRLLVRQFDIPVISAGGIMDGAGIAAVLHLGAAAAQLGTAFVASPESAADEGYRAALASGAAHHTVMTAGIRPARALPYQPFHRLDRRRVNS